MSEERRDRPTAISVVGISKRYLLYKHPADRLKEMLWPRRARGQVFWALRDISLDVPRGQVLGLIGANGSGKSTLLQLITGVLQPTDGAIATNGRVTALLELGAGFNPEFTGRENIALNATLLGLDADEIARREPDIIAFAEIGEFIDHPVKTYSSGMYVRLAFAIAVSVEPDILIVDEALAVGDAYFQHRCMNRMHEFRAAGKTILFVSHDTAAVKALCDRAILLKDGTLIDDGPPERVVAHYFALLDRQEFRRGAGSWQEAADAPASQEDIVSPDGGDGVPNSTKTGYRQIEREIPHIESRRGSGAARIVGIACYDQQGGRTDEIGIGQPLTIRISARFERSVAEPIIGFVIKDRLGTDLISANSTLDGLLLPGADADTIYTVQFDIGLPPIHPGHYAISPAIADGSLASYTTCDWIENARIVHIGGAYTSGSVMHPPIAVTLDTVLKPALEAGTMQGS
jgi:ABC-type polysaccharide/polyol phosphate transport system ATPase subunit